ncbi:MAG: hypothetical protein JSV38_00565 [Desulfobacterales bacterium]|nr:MAG: hypothetical protein JSV38_00565 [Desulfobacterales bacterium]
MLKMLNSLIVFLSIFCLALPAMAEAPPLCWVDDGAGNYPDPFANDDCISIANLYDARYAHETAPHAQKIQRGGWRLAAEFWNGAAANQEVIFHNNDTGDSFITSPGECYGYLFWNSCDADLWMGHNIDAKGNWDIIIDDSVVANVTPNLNVPVLPVIKIIKMRVKQNGKPLVVFNVPFDEDPANSNVRLRVFTTDPVVIVWQGVYLPPYELVTSSGEIRQRVRAVVPAKYAGHLARLEYRIPGARSVLWFRLPKLEE